MTLALCEVNTLDHDDHDGHDDYDDQYHNDFDNDDDHYGTDQWSMMMMVNIMMKMNNWWCWYKEKMTTVCVPMIGQGLAKWKWGLAYTQE